MARNRPLSFLDHHIRCGNSLIGVRVEDLKVLPKLKKSRVESHTLPQAEQIPLFDQSQFTKDVSLLMGDYTYIEKLPSDTVEQIKEKDRILRELIDTRKERYIKQANLWTSAFFGNEIYGNIYQDLARHISGDGAQLTKEKAKPYLKKAEDLEKEKRFFHWELEFPEVFFDEIGRKRDNPGFDAVVGNPPYVRIQERLDPYEQAFLKEAYETGHKNYDLYVLFVEIGANLLNLKGCFGYILPNKFFQLEYGEKLRGKLIRENLLNKIVNFGDNQIFGRQTTYTCLLFLGRASTNSFEYLEIPPLQRVEEELPIMLFKTNQLDIKEARLSFESFDERAWVFGAGIELQIIKEISEISIPLGEVVSSIIVGLQTSADNVYILEKLAESHKFYQVYSRATGKEYELEKGLLKHLISGEHIDLYFIKETSQLLIFPYKISKGEAILIPEEEFNKSYSKIWLYLKENEKRLRDRENGKMDHERWYAFGRHQNLTLHDFPKFAVPRLVSKLAVAFDSEGDFYLDNVDVGGVILQSDNAISPFFLLSLLNSKLIDFIFKKGSVKFRGQFYSANRQFIEPLPIRRIAFTTSKKKRNKLLEKGKKLYDGCINKADNNCVTGFLEHQLSIKPESSDVVHDFLAFLAGQMIDMNKEKQNEIKGFLEWLENQLKIQSDSKANKGIDALTGKTHIKNYIGDYQKGENLLSFKEFWNILENNKNKIQANLKSREVYENIQSEYEKSLSKLLPLNEKLRKTDWLIDQIVYKLYGLTEEEIKIVESNR